MDKIEGYVGKLLDNRYHIQKVLGVGGMAVVFEANDVVMNRKVAIKMLKEEMSRDEQAVKRFIIESKAVSMLSHPNIVKIFDVSVKGSLKYIVMERIEGITLKSYMQKKGPLSTDEILSYTEQVLGALLQAHEKGIIHRDIKPQNILLLKNGKIKVTDFGIAKLSDSDATENSDKAIGTVYYISPEQASGKEIDARSDLYSLGVLMYEMSTGTLPFNADTPVSVALKQVNEKPVSPKDIKPDIPKGLEQIILGAMEKNPQRRFQSAEQMLKYVSKLRVNPDYIFKVRKTTDENGQTSVSAVSDMKKKSAKKRKRQSHSMLPIIFGVTVAFFIVMVTGAVSILDGILKTENQNAPTTIEIQSYIGESYDDAFKKSIDRTIITIEEKYVFDANAPKGTILKQEPSAGERRKVLKNKQRCTIVLTISNGTAKNKIPDFSLMDSRVAEEQLKALGFECKLEKVQSNVAPNTVISTQPKAGTEVPVGTVVTVYYSTGPKIDYVKVPTLVNLTPIQVSSKLGDDLKLGKITYENSDTVEAGKIISQSIASGTSVVVGTKINLVISLGPVIDTSTDTTDPGIDPPELLPDEGGGEIDDLDPLE